MPASIAHIPDPPRRGITALVAIAALLLAGALVALVWGLGAPVRVSVDGVRHEMRQGTTIAEMVRARLTDAHAGSLLSINGGIIAKGSGDPAVYIRNGRVVLPSQRVFEGDVITSRSGADRTERTASVKVSIDPTATITGSGPILKVVRPGKAGTLLVRRGAISRQIVSTKVLVPAENIVLHASLPASGAKLVALTFDDGPWPGQTEQIVAILKAAGVRGTFYQLGKQVKRHPEISRAVIAGGNVIGNHSWSHPVLTKMRVPNVRRQIADSAAAIKAATGVGPKTFRPPYGAINRVVWSQAKVERESIALWDVDTLDWRRPGTAKILSNMKRGMGHASIILMHDGGGDRRQTIAALPLMIDWLKARGYTFVTVEELQSLR